MTFSFECVHVCVSKNKGKYLGLLILLREEIKISVSVCVSHSPRKMLMLLACGSNGNLQAKALLGVLF